MGDSSRVYVPPARGEYDPGHRSRSPSYSQAYGRRNSSLDADRDHSRRSSGEGERRESAAPPLRSWKEHNTERPSPPSRRESEMLTEPLSGQQQQPPTGPRHSYSRAPTGVDYRMDSTVDMAYPVPAHTGRSEKPIRTVQDREHIPDPTYPAANPGGPQPWDAEKQPTPETQQAEARSAHSISQMDGRLDSPQQPSVVYPAASIADRPGQPTRKHFPTDPFAKEKAEAYTASMDRIRSAHSLYQQPEFVALRKVLTSLADSSIELAGARARTNVAEAALVKAQEDGEAWSLDSARMEIRHKNTDVDGWFSLAHSS